MWQHEHHCFLPELHLVLQLHARLVRQNNAWAVSAALACLSSHLPEAQGDAWEPAPLWPWVVVAEEVDALMESWGLGEQQQQIPTHAPWVLCWVGPSVQVSHWVLLLVV